MIAFSDVSPGGSADLFDCYVDIIDAHPAARQIKADLAANSTEANYRRTAGEIERERLQGVWEYIEDCHVELSVKHKRMMDKATSEGGTKKAFPPLEYANVPEVNDTYGVSGASDPSRKKRMAHPSGRLAQSALHYFGRHYGDAGLLKLSLWDSLLGEGHGVSPTIISL